MVRGMQGWVRLVRQRTGTGALAALPCLSLNDAFGSSNFTRQAWLTLALSAVDQTKARVIGGKPL